MTHFLAGFGVGVILTAGILTPCFIWTLGKIREGQKEALAELVKDVRKIINPTP